MPSPYLVFVTRRLPDEPLERLRSVAEVRTWAGEDPPDAESLRRSVARADGLLCLLTDRVDAALLEAAPRLRAVSNVAVGTDNVDRAECTRRGIPVGNTPGVLTETTADLAFALILAAARRVGEAERFVRAGRWRTWDPGAFLGRDVHGGTLGIVGFGAIGRAVARRASGFGMRVLYTSRREVDWPGAERVRLERLLAESDVVSLHCPLTEETRGLIGEPELRAMKPTAVLVNTARGPIVDQAALARALRERWIAAAGLDVTDPEPIPEDDPLLELENVVLLPHVGSASVRTRTRMADIAVDNVIAALEGRRMPHCANPEVYDAG